MEICCYLVNLLQKKQCSPCCSRTGVLNKDPCLTMERVAYTTRTSEKQPHRDLLPCICIYHSSTHPQHLGISLRSFVRHHHKLAILDNSVIMGLGIKRFSNVEDAADGPRKRHRISTCADVSPNAILASMSLLDLQSSFRALLDDPVCGPVVERQLQSHAAASLRAEQERVQLLADQMRQEARSRAEMLVSSTTMHGMSGTMRASQWSQTMRPSLESIYNLSQTDPRFNGPSLAWDVLIDIARMALCPIVGDLRLQGTEEDNNRFHEDAERILVGIAREELEDACHVGDWLHRESTTRRRRKVANLREHISRTYGPRLDHRYKSLAELLATGRIKGGGPEPVDSEYFQEYSTAGFW